jgi:hypothetical protein
LETSPAHGRSLDGAALHNGEWETRGKTQIPRNLKATKSQRTWELSNSSGVSWNSNCEFDFEMDATNTILIFAACVHQGIIGPSVTLTIIMSLSLFSRRDRRTTSVRSFHQGSSLVFSWFTNTSPLAKSGGPSSCRSHSTRNILGIDV